MSGKYQKCDWLGCAAMIWAGAGNICGGSRRDGLPACGGYFCFEHLRWPSGPGVNAVRCLACADAVEAYFAESKP